MPILTMQQQARELGRIRTGRQVATKGGKSRPEKLDRFRFTAPSKDLIERVAALYGGEVQLWEPPKGVRQYEVVSDAARVPVMLPPQPITQWFEVWSGGGIDRRCDGVDEQVSGGGCLCDADDMPCKPTTRLNVMLSDLAGLGLWRLESHGWYAAKELPGLAQFLAAGNQYVPAFLELQPRVIKKKDERYPREFMVPVLDVEQTPRALLASAPQAQGEIGQGSGSSVALPAGGGPSLDPDSARAAISAASTIEECQELWRDWARDGVLTDELKSGLRGRVTDLSAAVSEVKSADELWAEIVQRNSHMSSSALEQDVYARLGVEAGDANAEQLRSYLNGSA